MGTFGAPANRPDFAVELEQGTLASAAAVSPWVQVAGMVWLKAGPTGAGTVSIEISFDGGTTVDTASLPNGLPGIMTVPFCQVGNFPVEGGVLARMRCVTFTSGPIPYRISQ